MTAWVIFGDKAVKANIKFNDVLLRYVAVYDGEIFYPADIYHTKKEMVEAIEGKIKRYKRHIQETQDKIDRLKVLL